MRGTVKKYAPLCLLVLFLTGCLPEKPQVETKDIVMYANLKNEEEAIRQYEYYHSKEGAWPEVAKANQASGIQKIKMYRFENQLIMILTVPLDIDQDDMNEKYAASSDRIGEWGKLMEGFFAPLQVGGEEMVWVEMKKIHHYEDGAFR